MDLAILTSVCIPLYAIEKLEQVVTNSLETVHKAFFILAGDLNQTSFNSVLSMHYQSRYYQCLCLTRGSNTLDKSYSAINDAHWFIPCLHFEKSGCAHTPCSQEKNESVRIW